MTWKEIKDAVEAKGVEDTDTIQYIDIHPLSERDIKVESPSEGWKYIWGF